MKLRGAQLGNSIPWGLIEFKQWFSAGVSKISLMTWLVPLRRFLGRCAEVGLSTCPPYTWCPSQGGLRVVGQFTWWLASCRASIPWKLCGSCMASEFTRHHSVVRLEAQAGPHSREVSWTSSFDNGVVLSHNRRPCGMRDTDVTSLENTISQSEKP